MVKSLQCSDNAKHAYCDTLRNCQSSVIIHVLYTYLRTVMQKKTCSQYARLVAHRYVFKTLLIYGAVWIGKIINKQSLLHQIQQDDDIPTKKLLFQLFVFSMP